MEPEPTGKVKNRVGHIGAYNLSPLLRGAVFLVLKGYLRCVARHRKRLFCQCPTSGACRLGRNLDAKRRHQPARWAERVRGLRATPPAVGVAVAKDWDFVAPSPSFGLSFEYPPCGFRAIWLSAARNQRLYRFRKQDRHDGESPPTLPPEPDSDPPEPISVWQPSDTCHSVF